MKNYPNIIPVFPLSGIIYFPKTNLPLNIFEQRYLNLVNDAYNKDKLIGMIQPLNFNNVDKLQPDLHQVGCLGKITSFKETEDGRYLIELRGLIRFEIMKEIGSDKKYREFEVNFEKFYHDLNLKKEELKFSDLELIFKNLKSLFALLLCCVSVGIAYDSFFRDKTEFVVTQVNKSDLNTLAEFSLKFNNEAPFLYGALAIILAISLGASASWVRKIGSDLRKKKPKVEEVKFPTK